MHRQWKFLSLAMAAMVTGSLLTGIVLTLPQGIRSSDAYAQQVSVSDVAKGNIQTAQDLSSAFRNVSDLMRPSVVSVRSIKKGQVIQGRSNSLRCLPPEFRRFFEENGQGFGGQNFGGPNFGDGGESMRTPDQSGIGSGVIVRANGYILTNNHVVEGADELIVQLSDNSEFPAEIVGTDPDTDLAVLKIDAGKLQAAPLGDSESTQVGDWVLAIGSPFELEQTVTAGIISAKNRVRGIVRGGFEDFLQTDAAINPGNSGGPLVNLRGEVIGINTAIVSRSGGYNGIGFAIPMAMARPVLDSIIESGGVRRGFLGAMGGSIPSDVADKYNLNSRSGAYIESVVSGQPAAQGGLQAGDVIQEANGRSIRDWFQFRNFIASQLPGNSVDLTVLREGSEVKLRVTLGERTDAVLASMAPDQPAIFMNARLQPLDEAMAREMGFDSIESGLLVTQIARGTEDATDLQAGDVIVAAQGRSVASVADLLQAQEQAKDAGQVLRLTVQRGENQELVMIK
jgi:serine protease Do